MLYPGYDSPADGVAYSGVTGVRFPDYQVPNAYPEKFTSRNINDQANDLLKIKKVR